MEWEVIMEFIRPELFIVIVFLWTLGLFLKKAPWFKAEWTIPFLLLGVSLIVTLVYIAIVLKEGFTPEVVVTSIIQAVILAAVAVFGYELTKQGFKRRIEDKRLE